jgi:hypothetical protein
MKQIGFIVLVALSGVAAAFAQSDDELVEMVRASAEERYLSLGVLTVSGPFPNSELSESDRKRISEQSASDKADCFADTVVEFASLYDISISEIVSKDGSIEIIGNLGKVFSRILDECIALVDESSDGPN